MACTPSALEPEIDYAAPSRPGAAKGMILQYNDSRGCGVRILTHNEHQTWLDDLWTQHPAELQVFELEACLPVESVAIWRVAAGPQRGPELSM